jgi:hypothetical protein
MKRMPPLSGCPVQRGYILRVSTPPSGREQFQIAAALMQGAAVVVVPQRCDTIKEWLARYSPREYPEGLKVPTV